MSSEPVAVSVHPLHEQKNRGSLELWTIWALLATFFIVFVIATPFLAVPLLTSKTFLLALGTLITLALYILTRLSRGNLILPPLTLIGTFWLPVIAYALSSLFATTSFSNALWGVALEQDTLAFMIMSACIGTLAALILRRSEHYRSFIRVGFWLFLIVTVLQVATIIVGQITPATISPTFSFLGSFEDLAFFLGLGVIASLITLRFTDLAQRTRALLLVCTTVALILLAIAGSSFVWILVALVSLGLFIETMLMRKPIIEDDLDGIALVNESSAGSEIATHSIAAPLVVLAVSLFFLIGTTLSGALANALNINTASVSPSWASTLSVAQKTYATNPVFGTGPGTFGSDWLKYRDPALNTSIFVNTEFTSGIGIIPTSLVTVGLLGAIAWAVFILALVVGGLRMLVVRTPEDPFIRYVAILTFVSSLYLFAAAIFRLPSAPILALAFMLVGVFASTTRFAAGSRQRGIVFTHSPRLGFVVVFSLTLLLLSSVVVAYALVERYLAINELARANVAFSAGNIALADQAVQNSLFFAPSPAIYQAQADIAIVRLQQIVASTTLSATAAQQAFQATLSSGINSALTATQLAPSDYQNWIALGNLYAQAVPFSVPGAYDSARAAYEKAQTLNPTNPQIPYILGQLDIAHKDLKTAETDLKAAIALKKDYTSAILLLSQIEVQNGKLKEALDAALAAAYFAPKDPNILFQVGVLRAAGSDWSGANEALSAAIEVSPQFANARYFLAAVYAKQGNLTAAREQLQKISALSADNAKALAAPLAALTAGKNPFPPNLLSASSTPVR